MRALAIRLVLACGLLGSPALAADLSSVDLSGDWYVLLRFKDSKSEDKSIVKFKDFAWTIEQTANTLTWEYYPYVVFDDDTENYRKHAWTNHLYWEPSEDQWAALKASLPVSSRAMTRKRMKGSVEEGYRSLPPLTSGGFNTMTYSKEWEVTWAPEKVRILIIDSLSGAGGLEGMDEATLYEVTERPGEGELRGTYKEGTKSGTFRMVRCAERQIVK